MYAPANPSCSTSTRQASASYDCTSGLAHDSSAKLAYDPGPRPMEVPPELPEVSKEWQPSAELLEFFQSFHPASTHPSPAPHRSHQQSQRQRRWSSFVINPCLSVSSAHHPSSDPPDYYAVSRPVRPLISPLSPPLSPEDELSFTRRSSSIPAQQHLTADGQRRHSLGFQWGARPSPPRSRLSWKPVSLCQVTADPSLGSPPTSAHSIRPSSQPARRPTSPEPSLLSAPHASKKPKAKLPSVVRSRLSSLFSRLHQTTPSASTRRPLSPQESRIQCSKRHSTPISPPQPRLRPAHPRPFSMIISRFSRVWLDEPFQPPTSPSDSDLAARQSEDETMIDHEEPERRGSESLTKGMKKQEAKIERHKEDDGFESGSSSTHHTTSSSRSSYSSSRSASTSSLHSSDTLHHPSGLAALYVAHPTAYLHEVLASATRPGPDDQIEKPQPARLLTQESFLVRF